MKFSEIKLQVTNAVRAYFNRSWTTEDLMNPGEIPENAYPSLIKRLRNRDFSISLLIDVSEDQVSASCVWSFLSLQNLVSWKRCIFASASKYFFHLMWEAGGLFTLLSSMASLFCLDFTSPLRVRTRVSLLMYAACNLGASFGLFTDYFPEMDQKHVFGLLASPTLGIGVVCFESLFTRDRSEIYIGCVICSWAPMFYTFVASNSDLIDSHATHYMLKICTVVALFLGYIVVYSQEILYDAQFGEIDFFNRTINTFFNLLAIVVHAVRVPFLGAEIEQHRQN